MVESLSIGIGGSVTIKLHCFELISRAGKPSFQVVTLIKNNQSYSTTNLRRHFAHVLPAQHQPTATGVAMVSLRARYYDCETGEFGSPDPLEYVDGMSLFRAYFLPNTTDPSGLVAYVQVQDPVLKPLKPLPVKVCDPTFVFNSDPVTSPNAVPWSNKVIEIPGRNIKIAAMTAYCVSIDCVCSECGCDSSPDCIDQQLDCEVNMSFHIFLNKKTIKDEGKTVDGIYGHEQRHVENYVREMKNFLSVLQSSLKGQGCMGPEDCRWKEDVYESNIKNLFKVVKRMNEGHKYAHPTRGLSEYKVLGDKRPTLPGKPSECQLDNLQATIDKNTK